jgi:hypothetical protein
MCVGLLSLQNRFGNPTSDRGLLSCFRFATTGVKKALCKLGLLNCTKGLRGKFLLSLQNRFGNPNSDRGLLSCFRFATTGVKKALCKLGLLNCTKGLRGKFLTSLTSTANQMTMFVGRKKKKDKQIKRCPVPSVLPTTQSPQTMALAG